MISHKKFSKNLSVVKSNETNVAYYDAQDQSFKKTITQLTQKSLFKEMAKINNILMIT